ncbi:MAG: 23S rRNA pseudouridine(955/2504/2580) synthase, partial [Gammaproteobacteria bacterium]|nr:23S rRNA pseudouridine(955/2504/2580) synthase [Gammaproteobacteria bacterium]
MSISHHKVAFVTVADEHAGQRIDNFLASRLKGLPRSRLYRLLRKGEVRVNKGRVKPEYKLASGDLVRIPPMQLLDASEPAPVSAALAARLHSAVLYEDSEWVVINKPAGLAVHGGSGESLGLIEALRQVRAGQPAENLELCHRLDKDTSGCLVVAKKRAALKRFHAALRDKQLQKHYLALVVGHWPRGLDVVNAPLQKNVLRSGERMVCVDKAGKPSKTLFSVVQRVGQYTL